MSNEKDDTYKYAGVYKDLVALVGHEAVLAIYENMKGQQVTFPNRLYSTEYIVELAKKAKDGDELKKIALKYDYTERRLRQRLKQ